MQNFAATPRLSRAERTRISLIRAALVLFGEKGFAATSTREIAALAGANIASIAYHFGGKDGLRIACADHVVETISGVAAGVLKQEGSENEPLSRKEAQELLRRLITAMVGFLVARPESGEIVQFVLRELSQPTVALDKIYVGVFEPVHKRLCQVWEAATGEPAESERTKITVFTLIGQIVYFRIGREAVMRRLDWREIGKDEAAAIVDVATENLFTILEARERRDL